MIINKKLYWIPAVIIAFGFLSEFLANKISFLSKHLAYWTFWVGAGTVGLLVFLELFDLFHKYANENFMTPRKKLKKIKESISQERKEIKKFLSFDPEGQSIDRIRNHSYGLKETHFSKDALAPYAAKWFSHVSHIHKLIREDDREEELEDLKEQKEELKQEIKELEQEKEKEQLSEAEKSKTEREKFLEEHQDDLYIHTEILLGDEEKWLAEAGYEKTHQWDIESKESKEMMIKKRHNESHSHAYLVGALLKHLRDELSWDEVKIYETKLPDLVFSVNGFDWAIEVETGTQYKKNPKALKEKVQNNNKKYGKDGWFFVVTNKNLIAKYRQFGDTVDRNNVLDKLEGIIYPEGRGDTTP